MNNKTKTSSFTLIELILVLIIIGVVYTVFIPQINIKQSKTKDKIEIKKLKSYLINRFSFDDEIRFLCISKDLSCYVEIDNNLVKDFKLIDVFSIEPSMYKYNKNLDNYELGKILIDDFTEEIVFEYTLNNDYKSNEFILDSKNEKVYMFNAINNEALIFKSLDDNLQYINNNYEEVKSAF